MTHWLHVYIKSKKDMEQKNMQVSIKHLLFLVAEGSAHTKTLDSVVMVPICPKMDVLCTYNKQFCRTHGVILHMSETSHWSLMTMYIGQKNTLIVINVFLMGVITGNCALLVGDGGNTSERNMAWIVFAISCRIESFKSVKVCGLHR